MRTVRGHTHWRLLVLVLILGIISLGAFVFRSGVQHYVVTQLVCRMDGPPENTMTDLLLESKDPLAFLQQLWATQKIPHRRFVADALHGSVSIKHLNLVGASPMLLAAAQDPDLSVRELALATLAATGNPSLFPAACGQLRDCDPEIKLLGLRYLRKEKAREAFPILIELLEDPDLRVVAGSATLLRKWTGIDYGIRLAQSLSSAVPEVDRVNRESILHGAARWKEWWQQQKDGRPANAVRERPQRLLLAKTDFTLANLDGKPVRLSEFRGKKVLINFWTTWCSACAADFPRLSELQRKLGDKLVVLGVSLDGVPDEHGHGQKESPGNGASNGAAPDLQFTELKRMVKDFVAKNGIAYRVLHDPRNEVGVRFNGSELPTTILIDSNGRVTRRFVGARSTAVLETMLNELN
jgi:cytochrome c biogenesis protein CcmG/thiol:disulfide interchange protein DsbE